MPMLCRLLGHAAMDAHHHNQGLDFALCERCGEDLIRRSGDEDWAPLPLGTHVVWREAGSNSAAVAERMVCGAVPPRRSRRMMRGDVRTLPTPHPRPHQLGGRTVLIGLVGKYMLAGLADRLLRPAPSSERIIYLPAPKAAPRPRRRYPRAWSSERTASLPRPSDRREIW